MFQTALIALAPFLTVLVGLGLLCLQAHLRARSRALRVDWLVRSLTFWGCLFSLAGLFAVVGMLSNVAFVIAWSVTAVLLLAALSRFQDAERRSLLWTLMVASERAIPLDAAARAFGEERPDTRGTRALVLADYLEAGLPLALALQRSRHRLPPALLLAADLGQQTGELGPALRQVLDRPDDFELLQRTTAEKLVYLVILTLFTFAAWFFVMLKIVPVFEKILHEFGVAKPPVTDVLIAGSRLVINNWFVLLPAFLLLPLLGRLWHRGDTAVILRWLAIAVRSQRPIGEMVELLADRFPRRRVRVKLQRAAQRMEQGGDWCESLRHVGLMRDAESVVFQAAGRAGNLAWALDELADSRVRRSTYRLRAFVNVAFPAVLAVFGGFVLVMALGLLAPLLALLQRLAG